MLLSRRLVAEFPGVGPVTAASAGDEGAPTPHAFRSGRLFASLARLERRGTIPRAGKTRLGKITRAGDESLRRLLGCFGADLGGQAGQGARVAGPAGSSSFLSARAPKHCSSGALPTKWPASPGSLMTTGEDYDSARIDAAVGRRRVRDFRGRPAGSPTGRTGAARASRLVGPIDPGMRANPWGPIGRTKVAWFDWNVVSRKPSWPAVAKRPHSTGRTYGRKRSDYTSKSSCATGAVHIWVPAYRGDDDGRCLICLTTARFDIGIGRSRRIGKDPR